MWPFKKKQAIGKYPSRPIYYNSGSGRPNKIHCPKCGTDKIKSAGYGNRYICKKGHIFT